MQVPNDVILQVSEDGRLVLYNVFTHNTIAIDKEAFEILSLINQGSKKEELLQKFESKIFKIWKIGIFSNYEGLFADPTNRIREIKNWPNYVELKIDELIRILEEEFFIIDNEKKYEEYLKSKISLLDKEHIGNFHQQLGQFLLLEKREDPVEWWVNQKFTRDYKDLKENLYKFIQKNFLRSFFLKAFDSSHKVIDLGCGIGLYSNLMAESGAEILGVDPNEKYIEIATKNKKDNVSFKTSKIGIPNALDWIESDSVDFVFMSDALLFYFVSPDPKEKPEITILLESIRRILKPNGRFISMEPHGMFFLRPWLGEIQRPYTIITEYKNKKFDIVPNIQDLLKSFMTGGFVLKNFEEIYVDKNFKKIDERAGNFADEYPLWWLFELEPVK